MFTHPLTIIIVEGSYNDNQQSVPGIEPKSSSFEKLKCLFQYNQFFNFPVQQLCSSVAVATQ
jgi:hypothetical protein